MATVDELAQRIEALEAQIQALSKDREEMLDAVNELNNILAAMKGHAQLARLDPSSEKAADLIEVVLTSVQRAQEALRSGTRRTQSARSADDGSRSLDPSQHSILVVDDEELIRSLLRDLLMRTGYNVSVAASGQEAIDTCQDRIFDLIFMDYRLGDMDGARALREIRDFQPNSKVIFVTGDPAIEEVHATVIKEGADGFMTKPFDLEDIQQAVRQILGMPVA